MSYYKKLSESKIFKLDDKGEPIGIFKLRRTTETPPGGPKELSKRCHSLNKKETADLIGDLSYQIEKMITKPDTNYGFETMIFVYESELKMTLKKWKFSEDELNPQLKQLIQKMRKVLRKKFTRGHYPGITGPKSQAFESAMWADMLMAIFKKYIHIKDVDAWTYVSYVLKASSIEKGYIKTIFNRIIKRSKDHRKLIEENNEKMTKALTAISCLENNL